MSDNEPTAPSATVPPGAHFPEGTIPLSPLALDITGERTSTAFASPTKKVSPAFLALFLLAFMGAYVVVLSPILVTLAVRVSTLVPADQAGGALGGIVSIGALFALLAQPLFGRLSDSTTSRFGMRRPWIFFGVAGATVGTLVMAFAPSVPILGLGFVLTQSFTGAIGATLYAVIADRVPPSQRGVASGILGIAVPISLPLGTFLVRLVSPNTVAMFAVALVGVVPVLLFAFTLKDRHLPPEDKVPFSWKAFFGAFWTAPIKNRDFGLVWWGRFFFILAYSFLTTYQAFFLITQLGATTATVTGLIFTSTLFLSALTLLSSLVGGKLSDVLRRRKVFVVIAAVLYGAGLIVITQSTSFSTFLVGIAIAGFGFGVYGAVDGALLLDVLPSAKTAAKDLAVGNIANTLPQSLAPALAPLVLALSNQSYSVLYLVAAGCAIVSVVFIFPIKSSR